MRLIFAVVCLLFATVAIARGESTAAGGTTTRVTCNSPTVPVQIVDKVQHGCWVSNAGAVLIWVAEVETSALMTDRAGVPLYPGSSNLFAPEDGWHGHLWCLTDVTGSSVATVNCR